MSSIWKLLFWGMGVLLLALLSSPPLRLPED
jgi:hypothetical protein